MTNQTNMGINDTLRIDDLKHFFAAEFSDCYQAANYIRAMNGLKQVRIPDNGNITSDINLINWYLNRINYEWVDFAICLINKHIATLATIDGQKCLLGVQEIDSVLRGCLYSRHELHYPIYWVKRCDLYDHQKLKEQYRIGVQ